MRRSLYKTRNLLASQYMTHLRYDSLHITSRVYKSASARLRTIYTLVQNNLDMTFKRVKITYKWKSYTPSSFVPKQTRDSAPPPPKLTLRGKTILGLLIMLDQGHLPGRGAGHLPTWPIGGGQVAHRPPPPWADLGKHYLPLKN